MATDVERLVLELSADVAKLDRGMRQGQRIAEQRTRAIEKSFERMSSQTNRSVENMGAGIRNTIASIALGAAVREVGQYADAWNRLANPLRAAGLEQEAVNAQMDELVAISLRSRSSLEGTVTLYSRLTAASTELGVSQEQVARVVETVNKALATSNMTGGERASAITQLAQGLGSGNLAGDELKAIRENSIVLAQAIADEFKTTIGGLKELGAKGELTSKRVFGAIETAQARVDAAFARTTGTISDAFTNLQTRATQFIGKLDEATGASAAFAGLVNDVANNLDAFADAAIVAATVVGGALAGRAMVAAFASFFALQAQVAITNAQLVAFEITSGLAAGSLGRMSAAGVVATGAMRGLSGALAFVGGPIGLAIIALGAAIALVATNTGKAAEEADKLAARIAEQAKAAGVASAAQGELANEITATQRWAAALTGETDKLADAHWRAAAAAKAQAIEEARLRLETARTTLSDAREALSGRAARESGYAAQTLGSGARSGLGPTGQPLGNEYAAARARTNASQEVGNVVAATAVVVQETANLNSIMRNALSDYDRPAGAAGGDDKKGGKGRSGPSPEELAAMRTQLDLQMQLDRARATANEAEEKRVQRLIDIASLTDQLTRAQVAGAEAIATAQVDAIIAGEATQKQIDDLIAASERRTEARVAAEAALTAEMDRQLQVQIDLARIEGNEAVIIMLERELQLRQALAALGPGATAEQRAAVRGDEAMLNRAEDRARLVEDGREMARNFLDIVSAEDPWTEAGNCFRQAAFDNLEAILGNVFAQLMNGNAQGGGVGGAVANVVGSLFGGRRALGGPVKAGQFYKVNENTPNSEYFSPKQDGWVGNMKPQRAQASRGPVQMTFRTEYNLQGAAGTEAILGTVQRMQAASERRILTTVQAAAPNAQLEQQLLKG